MTEIMAAAIRDDFETALQDWIDDFSIDIFSVDGDVYFDAVVTHKPTNKKYTFSCFVDDHDIEQCKIEIGEDFFCDINKGDIFAQMWMSEIWPIDG